MLVHDCLLGKGVQANTGKQLSGHTLSSESSCYGTRRAFSPILVLSQIRRLPALKIRLIQVPGIVIARHLGHHSLCSAFYTPSTSRNAYSPPLDGRVKCNFNRYNRRIPITCFSVCIPFASPDTTDRSAKDIGCSVIPHSSS